MGYITLLASPRTKRETIMVKKIVLGTLIAIGVAILAALGISFIYTENRRNIILTKRMHWLDITDD